VHLVFTHHGFLLDGWSVTLLFGDLEALVQAELDGAAVPAWPGAPFRDYVARLQGRDRAAEESYWRAALGGVQAATPLPAIDRPAGDVAASGQVSLGLSTSESERIRSVLRRLGVTVGVYAQAAWAITLAGLTGVDDVVFGLVVSGRTVELPGVDRTVGHLTNTVPVRIGTRPGTAAGAWLREMTVRHAMTLANEHTALTEIHPLTEIPAGSPLVRSVLVVQNYPQSRAEEVRSVRISHAEAQESVPMPMTLFVVPGDAIDLRLSYRTELVSERTAEATLTAMRAALLGLTDEDGQVDAISVVPDGFRPPDPVLAGVAEPERQSPVAPRDPVEEMIATVWRDVLAREDIGVHDDFFALGGDSLMAIRVVGRIRELTTIEYPVAEFFDEPTIAAAAGSVGRMLADAADRLTDLVDEVELSHVDG
jgi:acyl carrier protein